MGDLADDIFLETLSQLITNSKLVLIICEKHQLQSLEEFLLTIGEKHQLQSLEMEIKYPREFLKVTENKHIGRIVMEKKHNEHIEVMNLVRQIKDVVFELMDTVQLLQWSPYRAYKRDHLSGGFKFFKWFCWGYFRDDRSPDLEIERVKKEIKTLAAKVKQMYDENMYDINGTTVKKLKHPFTRSSGSETLKQLITSSNLDFPMDTKDQLQSLEKAIKYLIEFLKIIGKKTKKKCNEYSSELESLEEEINYLIQFLEIIENECNKYYEYSKEMSSEVMKLVMQIIDVKFEAENIVELFMVLVFEADHTSDSLREHQDHIESVKKKRSSVEEKIKTLTEVKHIYEENMYDLNGVEVKKLKHSSSKSEGGSSSSRGKNTSKVVEENTLVGFEVEVEMLMGKLHDSGESGQLEIISIIGAGGGGKTTLAREVYDHCLTLHKFEIRAWLNVSQDYHKAMKRDFLISILESASPRKHEDYGDSGEDELGEKVYKCLRGRKYLIVMDDIWDIEAWNDIQRSFPKECKGSKVLLTSRVPVQPASVPCVSHCLKPLPNSCSWELLQKKVFGKKQCPPKLVDIGIQIAEKCQGLPLAVVTIAGILAMEDKTLDVWEKVAKNLCSIIAESQEGCMEILELSYNHLPLHLKACFLYIGGYPEDSEIPVRELIWLWIALGFIQQSDEGKSLEAIAQDYLNDLIDRSLVMVARKSKSLGGIKACRIHDLLRELCSKKAKLDYFPVQNYRYANKHRLFSVGRYFCHEFPPRLPPSRRFPLPNSSRYSWFVQDLSFFVENFDHLRVLHFISPTSIEKERIEVKDLFHLRYFAVPLPEEKSRQAPNSVPYLPNLETVNLKASSYREKISLPHDIVKMVKLRHLYTKGGRFEYHHVSNYDEDEGNNIPKYKKKEDEGNMMDSLQTLHRMCACEDCLCLLKRTPNLRKLGLYGGRGQILADLGFLKCLEILYVEDARIGLVKLPSTLKRLTLQYTRLEWEELSIILQTLPSLEVLKLLNFACYGPVWNTSELVEGFSQLKYLKFQFLDIEEWIASEDQFPSLEVLEICSCEKLERIPIDFADLNELHEIQVRYSRLSAEESATEIQEKQISRRGDDDCPNITFLNNR